jgi:hypothetical protein
MQCLPFVMYYPRIEGAVQFGARTQAAHRGEDSLHFMLYITCF